MMLIFYYNPLYFLGISYIIRISCHLRFPCLTSVYLITGILFSFTVLKRSGFVNVTQKSRVFNLLEKKNLIRVCSSILSPEEKHQILVLMQGTSLQWLMAVFANR